MAAALERGGMDQKMLITSVLAQKLQRRQQRRTEVVPEENRGQPLAESRVESQDEAEGREGRGRGWVERGVVGGPVKKSKVSGERGGRRTGHQDTRTQDAGRRPPNAGCWMLDAGRWTLDAGTALWRRVRVVTGLGWAGRQGTMRQAGGSKMKLGSGRGRARCCRKKETPAARWVDG